MKIEIDKEKMWKRVLLGKIHYVWWIIGFLLLPKIVGWFGKIMREDWQVKTWFTLLLFGIFIVWSIINIICDWFYTKTLEYEITDERLLSTYKIITKHKDSARLQVVNSVDVTQGLLDKIFDLFTVEVCYGFSGEGYQYYFNYLSEEEADKLMDKIKPTGKSIKVE